MNPLQSEVIDTRLIKGLALDIQQILPLDTDASIEDVRNMFVAMNVAIAADGEALVSVVPVNESLSRKVRTIIGSEGNEIELYFTYPKNYTSSVQSVPCVLYIHGGGMAFFSANGPFYRLFSYAMAEELGAIVVGVEFRNSANGHVFPAGLNDCKSVLDWIVANKEDQRISRIFVVGESGGANLSIATALLAKREGGVDNIAGVYAMCPFISGLYHPTETEEAKKYPSLQKYNNCGIVDLKTLHFMQRLYDPEGQHTRNPLAWPLWASEEDLTGLPPHAISLNEADVLYDEGLAFYRKLRSAGVRTTGRTVLGTCHAGDFLGVIAAPDLYKATLYDLKAFVDGLL